MLKYLRHISLRLFFILLGLLLCLSVIALIRGNAHIRLLLMANLAVLLVLAWWLARSINRIRRYAEAMAANRPAAVPQFGDSYLYRLVNAITHLRNELNHKEHIEHYVLGLTHQLKTPLTAQQAAIELLQDTALNPEQEQLIERIARNSRKQQQLITRLLALARLENRYRLETRDKLSLKDLMEQALQECSAALATKELKIRRQFSPGLYCQGDALLLRQAIDNLLYNAIDFADNASSIDLHAYIKRGCIHLHVINQGALIPEYALAKIPQRFFSLPRADGQRSSGLGLSFVAEIMRLHGGTLHLANQDKGVIVSLILPLAAP